MRKRRLQALLLRRREGRPGWADGSPGHQGDVEGTVNDRRQLGVTPAFPEHSTLLHVAEQNTVEASHCLVGIGNRRRCWCNEARSDKDCETKGPCFPSPDMSQLSFTHCSSPNETCTNPRSADPKGTAPQPILLSLSPAVVTTRQMGNWGELSSDATISA